MSWFLPLNRMDLTFEMDLMDLILKLDVSVGIGNFAQVKNEGRCEYVYG